MLVCVRVCEHLQLFLLVCRLTRQIAMKMKIFQLNKLHLFMRLAMGRLLSVQEQKIKPKNTGKTTTC